MGKILKGCRDKDTLKSISNIRKATAVTIIVTEAVTVAVITEATTEKIDGITVFVTCFYRDPLSNQCTTRVEQRFTCNFRGGGKGPKKKSAMKMAEVKYYRCEVV